MPRRQSKHHSLYGKFVTRAHRKRKGRAKERNKSKRRDA